MRQPNRAAPLSKATTATSFRLPLFAVVSCVLGITIEWWYNKGHGRMVSKYTQTLLLEHRQSLNLKQKRSNEDPFFMHKREDSYQRRRMEDIDVDGDEGVEDKDPENPDNTDDGTRDETCRKYLVNFLNGTTDAKDECQGFLNAWKAADCRENKHVSAGEAKWFSFLHIIGFLEKRRHRSDNGTIVTDDVVIDDYYEAWECCSSINDFYEKHCQRGAELDSFKMLGIVMVLVVCGCVKSLIKVVKLQWIPDAGACILVGAIVGGLLRLISPEVVKDKLTFDNDLFLQILLPPIIFEAAITIDKRAFRRDLFPILTLAIFGTGFSAVAIGYMTNHLSSWGGGVSLPILDSLLFGALM
jgi:Sodium/hydrogen exchanger family